MIYINSITAGHVIVGYLFLAIATSLFKWVFLIFYQLSTAIT